MKTICYLADASNPHTIKWCNYFKSKGYAEVIEEEELTPKKMIDFIKKIANNKTEYIKQMEQFKSGTTAKRLTEKLLEE